MKYLFEFPEGIDWESAFQLALARASVYAGKPLNCKLDLDTHGKVGGWAKYGYPHVVSLNWNMCQENRDEMLNDVLLHEVSHIAAREIYGRGISAHGAEWQRVMIECFGRVPSRCHEMKTISAVVSRAKKGVEELDLGIEL